MRKPPAWIPYLGPPLAVAAGAGVGPWGLGLGFWAVLACALIAGFLPILGYRLWKRAWRRGGG